MPEENGKHNKCEKNLKMSKFLVVFFIFLLNFHARIFKALILSAVVSTGVLGVLLTSLALTTLRVCLAAASWIINYDFA